MRIGILFNVMHESLARALSVLVPDAEIHAYSLDRPGEDENAQIAAFTALRLCDHVFTQDAGPAYGKFSNRALGAAMDRLHRLPALEFAGFHPDSVKLTVDGVPVAGPTGTDHSRIAAAAFLAGIPADETANLYTALVFARLGYVDVLDAECRALIEKFRVFDVHIAELMPRWRAAGCFMHAPDRPKLRITMDLARIACAMMGITPQTPSVLPQDPLAAGPRQPYFADLARRHGLPPEGEFRGPLPAPPLTTEDFVLASYDVFRRTPRACLRSIPGVAQAAATLGFPAPRRPARALMPGAVALLTWHGTIVRLERASNLLVHETLWPDSDDSVDFTLTPETAADGSISASVLPGLQIVPGILPGSMALRRDGAYLTADPRRLAVPFRAEAAGPWESFVPLTLLEATSLRAIAAAAWSCNGGPPLHPATITMRDAFTLALGEHTADLRLQRPQAASPDGFTLRNEAGVLTLSPAAPVTAEAIPLLPVPGRVMPPMAVSVEAFRGAGPASWLLEAADDILHPPLTGSVEDAAWLSENAGIAIGASRHEAILRRMPATLLLTPGFRGMLIDARGVLAHAPQSAPKALPAGITRAHNILTASPALLAQGPVETSPVLVMPPPASDADAWLAGLTLSLAADALPRGTTLLLPECGPADEARLAMLGLANFPRAALTAPVCQVRDALWLEPAAFAAMPSALVQSLRARFASAAPADAHPRIFIQPEDARAANPKVAKFLQARGFVTVVPEQTAPDRLRDLFLHASLIVAPSGPALCNLIFCAPGTTVLELAPEAAFRPDAWLIAAKLGLVHGVLPCASSDGALHIRLGRMRALLRMLRTTQEDA